MTGPNWLPIAIPIVALLVLSGWLAAVYYADAHPGWSGHGVTSQQPAAGVAARQAGPPPEVPRQAESPEAGQGAGPEAGTKAGAAPARASESTTGR